jgi:coenzyme F420-dependent glucose-6-phosphate dehydrogenase
VVNIGYALSSEEHSPNDLVRNAQRAEEIGFSFAMISDHFHPWTDSQGQSPFVWSTIGGIAQATSKIRLGTAVTCPTVRIHPAIIAHAAATSAAMMPGRFFLGVGTGENLNEHILGDRWPAAAERRDMLAEAIEVMRMLWEGGFQNYSGVHYQVENARLYTLPDEPVEVMVAASGPLSAELAGSMGDGLISTSADEEVVQAFRDAGGGDQPRIGQYACCWANNEDEAKETAHRIWPNGAIVGELSQELPLPRHFEQAAQLVSPDDVAKSIICGPDPAPHLEKIQEYIDAGFDHVYVHQVGPDQEGFFRFFERDVLPNVT